VSALVGLDIGTTGARALAVNAAGVVLADVSVPFPLLMPFPGWAEQPPEDWWRAAQEALRRIAVAVRDAGGEEIVGIGLTGQMHGAVFLDANDAVIRPALLWNDQRTEAQCREITERVGAARLLAVAGNPALTGFQAPKILWLREAEPENYARVASVLLPKDYIRLLLTGERATDASDASGTLLLDVRARDWSPEILAALDIPREWLPHVYEGPEIAGRLLPSVAETLGLPSGIPVAAGGGDNAAAAIGTGVITEGIVSVSVGTSGVVFAHTDTFTPDPSGRIHAFCHAVPGAYHLMAVTLSAGGSLRWWRDMLGNDANYDTLAAAAGAIPAGAEGLVFLPYLTGERTPHLDPSARGAFVGLTARHTQAHLTRAVMEGVVFSLRAGLEIMRELGVLVGEVRATGGGARNPLWRQLQADICAIPVHRTVAEEGPALGAALLGGVAAGVYRDVAEACNTVRLHPDVDAPDPARLRVYDDTYAVYQSLYPVMREAMHRLSDFATTAEA